MAYDLSELRNIEKFELNKTRIGNGTDVPENIILYTRDAAVDLWINSITFALFVWFIWFFTEKKNYNFYQATMLGSLYTLALTIVILLSGWSKNIYPLILYGTIAMLSSMFVYLNKKKGFN